MILMGDNLFKLKDLNQSDECEDCPKAKSNKFQIIVNSV